MKTLYPIIGKGESKSNFLICLTNEIMVDPLTETDQQKASNDEYNPLAGKGTSVLEKIYNGKRNLPAKDAGEIVSRLDKEKFIEYLSEFPDDTIKLIGIALNKNGVNPPVNDLNNIINACTDLFVSVLANCASEIGIAKFGLRGLTGAQTRVAFKPRKF